MPQALYPTTTPKLARMLKTQAQPSANYSPLLVDTWVYLACSFRYVHTKVLVGVIVLG